MMFQDVSSTELCRNLDIFRNGKSTNKYLKHVSDAIRERQQECGERVTRGKCIFSVFRRHGNFTPILCSRRGPVGWMFQHVSTIRGMNQKMWKR